MKKVIYLLIIVLMGFFLTGCAVKLPAMETYVITAISSAPLPKHRQTHLNLLVTSMIANPGYEKKRMIYMTSPDHLNDYSVHEWAAPPAQMLTSLIAERLQDTGYFHAVVIAPSVGKMDYRLDTRLIVLHQEILPLEQRVRCIIQATLINVKTQQIVASRRFQALVPVPGGTPASGAVAANQAATQIANQLSRFVIASVAG